LINHILLICSSVLIYEFLLYIKFFNLIKSNYKLYQKIIKLFKYKNGSDFRKEKLILSYSKLLFLVSMKIIIILISILVLMVILNLLSNSYLKLVISLLGIIELTAFFLVYYLIRKKFYAQL